MSDVVASHSLRRRTAQPRASGRGALRAYFLLTKPRVIELLLVTTVPAMILADDGLPRRCC